MADKWLLIGGDSEIGSAAHRYVSGTGRPVTATTRRKEGVSTGRLYLDLSRPLEDWEPPTDTRAACIFAAVARLAACHDDPVGSTHINVTQTIRLVERLLDRGIHVLYLSTNQVFDGEVPFTPADAPMNPVSEYGQQKARAETVLHELITEGAPVAILRLAKVFSPGMPMIANWIRALSEGTAIRAFTDMKVAPTPVAIVIAAICSILKSQSAGVFQLSGNRDVTYRDIAQHLAQRLNADTTLVTASLAAAVGLPRGSTPSHTTLDSTLVMDRLGISAPDPWLVTDELLADQYGI